MKKIKTIDAVGHVLCHDVTQIVRGKVKDAAFRKGHIIREEDIDLLLSLGKDHIYIYEKKEGMVHENDGAEVLAGLCLNKNMSLGEIKEGKLEVIANKDGFFRVNRKKLEEINYLGEMMIATRMGNIPVKRGDKLAGMRIIPLLIEEEKLERAREIAGDEPILELIEFKELKAAIVTTGNEVYYKRIKDTFTPVIQKKLEAYSMEIINHKVCPDDKELIRDAILESRQKGADLVICTGGMSVDPDDLTPAAIRDSGADIVSYGSPVLPGAMLLLGYFQDGGAIMGVPGCAMYLAVTSLDIILPYIVAGVEVDRRHIASLGYGGLCLNCKKCTYYPNCQFGKGV